MAPGGKWFQTAPDSTRWLHTQMAPDRYRWHFTWLQMTTPNVMSDAQVAAKSQISENQRFCFFGKSMNIIWPAPEHHIWK